MVKHTFEVQTGKGKSRYKTRYSFTGPRATLSRALLHYHSLLTHSGHKKRLLMDGKVIEREIT